MALLAVGPASSPAWPGPRRRLRRRLCQGCHNEASRKGQLDLTGLEFDASDPANRAVWIKVHDRVKAGEMPPRGKDLPDDDRRRAFVEGLARSIVSAERAERADEGRSIRRD